MKAQLNEKVNALVNSISFLLRPLAASVVEGERKKLFTAIDTAATQEKLVTVLKKQLLEPLRKYRNAISRFVDITPVLEKLRDFLNRIEKTRQ